MDPEDQVAARPHLLELRSEVSSYAPLTCNFPQGKQCCGRVIKEVGASPGDAVSWTWASTKSRWHFLMKTQLQGVLVSCRHIFCKEHAQQWRPGVGGHGRHTLPSSKGTIEDQNGSRSGKQILLQWFSTFYASLLKGTNPSARVSRRAQVPEVRRVPHLQRWSGRSQVHLAL